MLIGGEGAIERGALEAAGIASDATHPDFVVVGEGTLARTTNLLELAMRFLAKGSRLVATNPDTWCPTESGPRPGTGAYVAPLLESAGP